jgi:O-antigen ligase
VAFGWRAFATPSRGVPVVLALLPVLKTAGSSGFLVRFALPDLFTFVTLAGTIVALSRRRDGGWGNVRLPWQVLLGLGFLFFFAVTSISASRNLEESLTEITAYAVDAVLLALIVLLVRSRAQVIRCLRAWEVGALIALGGSVIGIALIFSGNITTSWTEGPKLASTFKKSGQLSAYLLPSIPLLWFNAEYLSKTKRARVARRCLFVAVMLALLATGSRTGLALGGGLILFLWGARWMRRFFTHRPGLKIALLVAVLGTVIPMLVQSFDTMPFAFRRAFSIMSSDGSLESLSPTRYHQFLGWQVAASHYPLLGVGTGDFNSRNTCFVADSWKSHEIHNTYLGVWAETGVFGILSLSMFYLGVLISAYQVLARSEDETFRALGFALVISNLVLFAYGVSNFGLRMRHLWSIFGLTLAAWNVVVRDNRPPPLVAEAGRDPATRAASSPFASPPPSRRVPAYHT